MTPEWIMAFIQLCNTAIATGKTIASVRGSQLGPKERELLKSAADNGQFLLLHTQGSGQFVETSGKRFTDDDPAITAHYLDAFIRLCDSGLILHQIGSTFRLTGAGFDIARNLRDGKSIS